MKFSLLIVSCGGAAALNATHACSSASKAPHITLDYGTFRGTSNFTGVDSFLGLPFAKAGRYENPQVIGAADHLKGVQDATKYGPECPQQPLTPPLDEIHSEQVLGILSASAALLSRGAVTEDEDCLSINVQVPAGLKSTAGLPVLLWIHGGGFGTGASAVGTETTPLSDMIYQGARIVERSVQMGQPIVFVSANYRLGPFGGLASQEVADAGIANLMLKDQRVAMEWVQKYIQAFGGDPTKVTLFGESAGSASIAIHMVLNDGQNDGLFRGAIMASGGIWKLKDHHYRQDLFNFMAEQSGCGQAEDKVACLRTADYGLIYNATLQLPSLLSYRATQVPWYPRPDGSFLKASPHQLLRSGNVARVPYIIGDVKDEGTIFSIIASQNITTDAEFQTYFKTYFFDNLSDERVKEFTDLWPEDPTQGSPFGTGDSYVIGPQYKRLSAAVGDYTFQSGRRDLLQHTYQNQTAYTYLIDQQPFDRYDDLPRFGNVSGISPLGSFHTSEVDLNTFGDISSSLSNNSLNTMSTFIAFVNSLDPNNHGLTDLPYWPTWTPEEKSMLQYAENGCKIIKDDFREEAISFINDNADDYTM